MQRQNLSHGLNHQPPEDEPISSYFHSPTAPLMHDHEQDIKDGSRAVDPIALYFGLASALVLVSTTWTIILSNDPIESGWFSLHPTLNSLALLCFTFGILTLQPTSQPKAKAAGLRRHQIAMLTGLLSITVGISAMIGNKTSLGVPQFKDWHGILGLITFCWLVVQAAIGAGSVWFGGALFGGGLKAKLVWKYHRLSGYMLLISFLTTIYLGGAQSGFITAHSVYVVRLFAYLLAPIFILVSIYSRVRPSKMKFF